MGDCMNMFMNGKPFLCESLIKVDILKSENDLVANQRFSIKEIVIHYHNGI